MAAQLDEKSAEEQETLAWEVFPLNENGEASSSYIQYSYGATASYYLPAGGYQVQARLGSAQASLDVNIGAGEEIRKVLDLRAGKISFSAVLKEGGPQATGSIAWQANVYNPETEEKGGTAAYSYGASGTYVLNAGTYILRAKYQGVGWEAPITIAPGEELTKVAILNAGRLNLDARLSPDSSPVGGNHAWEIHKVNPDGSTGNRLTYSYGAQFSTLLPAGPVQIQVRAGNITRRERVNVVAGEGKTHTMELNGGVVKYTAVKPNGEPLGGNPGWEVHYLNEDGSEGSLAGYAYGPSGEFLFPATRLRISVRGNGFAGSMDFDLDAGETKNLTIGVRPQ